MDYSKNSVYIHSRDHSGVFGNLRLNTLIMSSVLTTLVLFAILNHKILFDNANKIAAGLDSHLLVTIDNSCQLSRDEIKDGLLPINIKSEKIGLDIAIEPVNFVNGKWKVNKGTANYAIGTSMINMTKGNTAIYGHSEPGVFKDIPKLDIGDNISVLAMNIKSKNVFDILYEVTETKGSYNDHTWSRSANSSQLSIISVKDNLDEGVYTITAIPLSILLAKCN